MENFVIDDKFYRDLEELIYDISEEEDLSDLEDDWEIEAFECNLEPVVTLNVDWIMGRISTDRLGEEDEPFDQISKILNEEIDFEKINNLIPKYYYPGRSKFTITKKDLLEWIT